MWNGVWEFGVWKGEWKFGCSACETANRAFPWIKFCTLLERCVLEGPFLLLTVPLLDTIVSAVRVTLVISQQFELLGHVHGWSEVWWYYPGFLGVACVSWPAKPCGEIACCGDVEPRSMSSVNQRNVSLALWRLSRSYRVSPARMLIFWGFWVCVFHSVKVLGLITFVPFFSFLAGLLKALSVHCAVVPPRNGSQYPFLFQTFFFSAFFLFFCASKRVCVVKRSCGGWVIDPAASWSCGIDAFALDSCRRTDQRRSSWTWLTTFETLGPEK